MVLSARNHGQRCDWWCWGCLSHTGVGLLGQETRGSSFVAVRGRRKVSRWEGCVCGLGGTTQRGAATCEMASLETRALSGKLRTAF